MDQINLYVSKLTFNPLKNAKLRLEFAKTIQSATNYFSVQEINNFLEEMNGLNLKNKTDQKLFIEFLSCWIKFGVAI